MLVGYETPVVSLSTWNWSDLNFDDIGEQVFLIKHYRNLREDDENFVLDFEEIYVIDSTTRSIRRADVKVFLKSPYIQYQISFLNMELFIRHLFALSYETDTNNLTLGKWAFNGHFYFCYDLL